eukprot:4090214-Pyramimonas_sp.AAC.1
MWTSLQRRAPSPYKFAAVLSMEGGFSLKCGSCLSAAHIRLKSSQQCQTFIRWNSQEFCAGTFQDCRKAPLTWIHHVG